MGSQTRRNSTVNEDLRCGALTCKNVIRVDNNDSFVTCIGCEGSYHVTKCSGMSAGLFKEMKKNSQVKWFCPFCDKSVSKVLAGLAAMAQKVEELTSSHDDLVVRVSDLEKRLAEADAQATTQATVAPTQWPRGNPAQTQVQTQATINELKDIESRKCNLILFNVDESTHEDGNGRKDDDLSFIAEVLGSVLPGAPSSPDHVRAALRLGHPIQNKKRPVRVIFSSSDFRDQVLKNRRLLKDADTAKLKSCFIKPDLTKLQQQEDRELYLKCKAAREDGKIAFIRNGRVIVRDEIAHAKNGEAPHP